MKINEFRILFFASLFASVIPAQAQDMDGAGLVQARRCYPCHDMNQTLIGPPYQAIALRHAENKANMVDVLAEKIIIGGGGAWGVVPMVPNEQVSREEARVIARWILDQGK